MTSIESNAAEFSKRYGVTEYRDIGELLEQHGTILRQTLDAIYLIGQSEAGDERKHASPANGTDTEKAAARSNYMERIHRREPIFSFLVDGPRGSGKTSLMLSIRYFAGLMCRGSELDPGDKTALLKAFNPKCDPKAGEASEHLKYCKSLTIKGHDRRLMLTLPPLRPDHMETSETIMEGVFAQMSELLTEEAARTQDEKRRKRAKDLKSELHRQIAKGWYFSRRMGVEALLNDSLNFEEYIERRSEEATWSHTRIKRWREYVVDFLDFFKAELLGIFLDDTDVANDLTVDLLHSIRMYFCHPRIVTVVAGNMHTMRQRLLQEAVGRLHKTSRSLRSPQSFTAQFWRRFERENIEEYLEKVFPRPMRRFIRTGPKEISGLLHGPFSIFCSEQMKARLPAMLEHRKYTCRKNADALTHMYHAIEKENRVENYLALWLLKNHYYRRLTPSTARHLNQFRSFLSDTLLDSSPDDPKLEDKTKDENERRVVVGLFTEPRNFELVQRFTDRDADVVQWISQQDVRTDWRTPHQLHINQLDLSFSHPSVEFLLFRLDLEFAMPKYAQQLANFPEALLPIPAGHNIWAPEVWEIKDRQAQVKYITDQDVVRLSSGVLRLRQDLYGLAQALNSPVIPANCLYFKDLRGLPDVTWRANTKGDEREDYASRVWDELPAEDVDILFQLDRYDTRNAYFRDVVTIFGSYPLTKPIPLDQYRQQLADLLMLEDLTLLHSSKKDPNGPPDWVKTCSGGVQGWTEDYQTEWVALQEWFSGDRLFFGLMKSFATIYRQIAAGKTSAGFIRWHSVDGHEQKGGSAATANAWQILEKVEMAAFLRFARDGERDQERIAWIDAKLNLIEKTKRPALFSAQPVQEQEASHAREAFLSVKSLFIDQAAPRYHRILCDVRRAYAAMRIFESDLNDFAVMAGDGNGDASPIVQGATPTSQQKADEGQRRRSRALFIHSRNDKMRLVGLHKIRTILGLEGVSYRRSGGESTDIGELGPDERYYRNIKGDGVVAPWACVVDDLIKGVRSKPTVEESVWANMVREEITALDTKKDASWISLLNCQAPDGSTRGDVVRKSEAARNLASHMRSLLLFLWGVGPTLTSLIHLEVMGEFYWWENELKSSVHGLNDKELTNRKKVIGKIIETWRETIQYATVLTLVFARRIEDNLERQMKENLAKGDTEECFTPFPDFSISTLGLRIYWDPASGEDPKLVETDRYEGIIGDILMRQQIALWYLDWLEAWRCSLPKSKGTPKPAGPKESGGPPPRSAPETSTPSAAAEQGVVRARRGKPSPGK